MLKRLMREPLVRRTIRSRRLLIAIGISTVFLAAGTTSLWQFWSLTVILLCFGLSMLTLIAVESMQNIMSVQNELRRQNRRQMQLLNNPRKGLFTDHHLSVEKKSSLILGSIDIPSSSSGIMKSPLSNHGYDYGVIHDWLQKNQIDGSSQFSVIGATGLLVDYRESLPNEVLHIGSANSALWLHTVMHGARSLPGSLTVLVGTSAEAIQLRRRMMERDLSNDFFVQDLHCNYPAGGSIGSLTAHMVDTIYIDLAVLESPDNLRHHLPSQFISWITPRCRVVLIDSQELDIRANVQAFLDTFPEFLLQDMQTDGGRATLVKVAA